MTLGLGRTCGGIAALAAAIWLLPSPAAQPASSGESPLGARIVFDSPVFNFGTVEQGASIDNEWVFRNEGTEPLIINQVKPSCGCTVVDWTKDPIPPGGSGRIKSVFHTKGKRDNQRKTITIHSNDPRTPQFILSIEGMINTPPAPELVYNPFNIDFGLLRPGGTYEQYVTLENKGKVDLLIQQVTGQPPQLTAALDGPATVPPGQSTKVKVLLEPGTSTLGGHLRRYVTIQNNDPYRGYARVGVTGYMWAPRGPRLTMITNDLDVGVIREPGVRVGAIPVINTGDQPLMVDRVQVLGQAVEAVQGFSAVAPGEVAEFEIRSRALLQPGTFQDQVVIYIQGMENPRQAAAHIRVSGYVDVNTRPGGEDQRSGMTPTVSPHDTAARSGDR